MDNKKLIEEIDNLDGEENKKKRNKNGIGIVTLVAIIILIVVVVIAFYKITTNQRKANEAMESFKDYFLLNVEEMDEDTEQLEENIIIDEEKSKAQIDNIKITKEFRDVNKNLGIILNNQNSETVVGMLVQVIFYNGENKPIKIDETFIDTLENNLDYYVVFDETPKEFERYEFLITKEVEYIEYVSLKNDVTFEVKDKNEDEIVITGKNNSKELIEYIEFTIVYYDENDNILGIDIISESDITPKDRFKIENYKYITNQETGEDVEIFRYDVLLTSAYSYVY